MASGMLLGAIGGLGQGLVNQSERIWKEDMAQMQAQIDAERERRIEEAAARAEGRREQIAIRGEQRQAEAHKAQRQDDLNFATDPKNVGLLAQASLTKQKAEDEYADTRAPIETRHAADKARAIDRATHHDNTDYEGRRLTHERARMELAALKESGGVEKMSDRAKKRFEYLSDELGSLNSQLVTETDDTAKVVIRKDIKKIKSEIDALTLGETGESKPDPIGQAIEREMLINEIKRLDPTTAEVNLTNEEMKQLIGQLKQEKAEKAQAGNKTKGLLQSGASGDY